MKKKSRSKITKKEIKKFKSLEEEMRKESRSIHEGISYLKKHLDKLWEHVAETNERLIDLEVQSNLMTRLITTICVERLKMHSDMLTKLIRKIEKEAIEDSQIMHLEHLFSLDHEEDNQKKDKQKPHNKLEKDSPENDIEGPSI